MQRLADFGLCLSNDLTQRAIGAFMFSGELRSGIVCLGMDMTNSSSDQKLPTPGVNIGNDADFDPPALDGLSIDDAIRAILRSCVFAPNNSETWAKVRAEVSSFLTTHWKAGELIGAKAADAFSVSCGLGSTMTADDVLNGDMRLFVMLHRAGSSEPTELTVSQKMAG